MASSSKYDFSSGSPDDPGYSNGQHGLHGAAFMDRSGSFREGTENRIPATLKSGSTSSQSDPGNLVQLLVSDLKSVFVDQKLPRSREIKKSVSSIFGLSSEESVPSTKPLPTQLAEDVKHLKATILEGSIKAKDQAKVFGEASSKIDKYFLTAPKRRSRADIASGDRPIAVYPGSSTPKSGSQGLVTTSSFERGPQRSEERAKGSVPSRRIRTSMVESRVMDVRSNSVPRSSGIPDREKDAFKIANGGTVLSEEKRRALVSGVDAWDKPNTKKKRSVIKSDVSAGSIVAKSHDGDRESKRGLQQKFGSDGRPRMNNTHGFRSGAGSGPSGLGKSDSASQQNGIGKHHSLRGDQDNSSLLNDRRDGRVIGLDKEGVSFRTASKLNGREDNCAASPTSLTKFNSTVRGPRSNSSYVPKASQNIHRSIESADNSELPLCTDKVNSVNGSINRKRSACAQSLSPPVAQWAGQRPQKISRVARRSNLPPRVSSHDEFPVSDMVESTSINDDRLEMDRHLSSNVSQQIKLKGGHVSTAGLLESDDPGFAENKSCNNKIKKCSEIEEKASQNIHKISTLVLPSRKTKVAEGEDLEDVARRQGRSGRGFTAVRSDMPAELEKPDNATITKQARSARVGSEKVDNKPGRPLNKKLSERKGHTRPRHSLNGSFSDFVGDSDDDREELLAAANAAVQTWSACSSPFWKQIEQNLAFISADDIAYLNQQICATNESAAYNHIQEDEGQNMKGDQYVPLPSSPGVAKRDNSDFGSAEISYSACNGDVDLANQMKHGEPFLDKLVGVGSKSISICQTLISAIIDEDEIESFYSSTSKEEELLHEYEYGVQSDYNAVLKTKVSNPQLQDSFQNVHGTNTVGNNFQSSWRNLGEVPYEKLGSHGSILESDVGAISSCEHVVDDLFPHQPMANKAGCTEANYNQMSIDDRILLELNEIGLHPEPAPILAQSGNEDIMEEINSLKEKLHGEVTRKNDLLLTMEKAVRNAREGQDRELERIAMDKLLGIAYDKYMEFCVPTSRNVSKIIKNATLLFVKRTLARCRKYEETGNSCFSEPPFMDIFHSVSSCYIDTERPNVAAEGKVAAASSFTPSHPSDHHSSVTHDKTSNAVRSDNHISEQMFSKEEQLPSRVKRRELLLDDVVGVGAGMSLKAPLGFGSSLSSGTKGKRSERDRDGKGHNRDAVSRNGTVKIGRPSVPNARSERKNKTKPKQRTAHLSASVNSLVSKAVENNQAMPPASKPRGVGSNKTRDDPAAPPNHVGTQALPNATENLDLSNLQLPELDVDDFSGQGQDLASWLNIDDDGLQDFDCMGLQIPMDDLSELNMMI